MYRDMSSQNYDIYDLFDGNRRILQGPYLIGVLQGEGIGPDIIQICLKLLDTIQSSTNIKFEIRVGGDIGKIATSKHGVALTDEVKAFCSEIFTHNGVLFCGPGGDRFVYDLRKEFNLFCKIAPIMPMMSIVSDGPINENRVHSANMLIIRENLAGIYQGEFGFDDPEQNQAWQRFSYNKTHIANILAVSKQAASRRKKNVAIITKPGGVPTISALWEDVAEMVFSDSNVAYTILEVDNACYQIIASPQNYDVIVAPNLFGDVIGDVAALLLGSRGMSFSANYSKDLMASVYQTSHGAAHDLKGKDLANPIGQILSLAMLLEQSFMLGRIAVAIRDAIDQVLSKNVRPFDLANNNSTIVGTQELGRIINQELYNNLTNS
jgi:3-isopropylmalate dehydrogenase